MPSFANSALRLLRRVLGSPVRGVGPYGGEPTSLDGNTAVALAEAGIADAAGLGASFPAESADLAWRSSLYRGRGNLFGSSLASVSAEGPRGALAAAIGLAMGGSRATCFLSGPDLAGALDLLRSAAGRRLPLVLHLANRALPAQGLAAGSGHEALHLATDTGALVLVAANVQEAVDLGLIGRRVAESTLTPVLVAMDGEETALSMQDVRLPSPELAARFVGRPGDPITSTNAAQRLLFGEQRRRIPFRHDLDHPVLQGALQSSEAWGLGAAAAATWLDADVHDALQQALSLFAGDTGRRHAPVSAHRMEDARLVLLAQGAAVETAEAVADYLRAGEKVKVGVLGLRCLRPFPSDALRHQLQDKRQVIVLERLDTPLADDPPLLRELRAALARDDRPGAKDRPPALQSVIYGLGGLPLRGADLIALCRRPPERPKIYLGMDFAPAESRFPKRQVLLDRLRREHPEIIGLGLKSPLATPDLRPNGTVGVAIHRRSGQPGDGLAAEIASLLRGLVGTRVRTRPALAPQPWGSYCIDQILIGPDGLRDAGAEQPVDLAILTLNPSVPAPDPTRQLTEGGALLVLGPEQDGVLWPLLDPALQRAIRRANAGLYALSLSADTDTAEVDPNEPLLGALCGILVARGWLDTTPRRLQAARDAQVRDAAGADSSAKAAAFAAGLEHVRAVDYAQLPDSPITSAGVDDQAPAVVRKLGQLDDGYDSLPRFWDQVGVLYRHGATDELTPDPYMALGAVPPLASAFRDLSPLRRVMPALKPSRCTGCGDCWTLCPDGAITAAATTPKELIDAAIAETGATALAPMAAKLAERITSWCKDTPQASASARDLIRNALDWMAERLPEDRRPPIVAAGERVATAVGALPAAVTAPLFRRPEAHTKGSGRLLFITVDPMVCKGCAICVTNCEPGALASAVQDRAILTRNRQIRTAWTRLPDTPQAAIDIASADPDLGPLPGALLARGTGRVMFGSDGVEAGSGGRLALRLALALAEGRHAPQRTGLITDVRAAHDGIIGRIREILANALPADDLDALSRSLDAVDNRQADLGAFLHKTDGIGGGVDAARLRRLVELARALNDLAWRLETGRLGVGRAALGLVLSPDDPAGWTGAFPQNAFEVPASVDLTGDGAQLAAGLLQGQLHQVIDGLALLRKARLELERPEDAGRLWADIEGLTYADLDETERSRCPSLLLVGSSQILGGRGLSQLIWLLGSGLPVKVVLLAELDLGLSDRAGIDASPGPAPDPTVDLSLLALSQRRAYIAQSSVGYTKHLYRVLRDGLDYDGPALFHIHGPSPIRHGFATDQTIAQARLAVATRTFPLLSYDPRADGVFGLRLELGANPDPLADWTESAAGEALTPAHFALQEARFKDWLSPLADDAPSPVGLATWLALPERDQQRQTPYVSRQREDQAAARYAVSPELARVCARRAEAWRTLQELAGLVTPFTERVRAEAEAAVAAERKAELAAQKADYERRIAELRAELEQEYRIEIRDRLMALAGYQPGGEKRTDH
jgi:pyruvate-ferredoxin/flavodoxin oxidoreductase